MSDNYAYDLFKKVFISPVLLSKYNEHLDFNYKGATFDYIKENYKSYTLRELREILYLYDILVVDMKFNKKLGRNIKTVIQFIEGEIAGLGIVSESEDSDISDEEIIQDDDGIITI